MTRRSLHEENKATLLHHLTQGRAWTQTMHWDKWLDSVDDYRVSVLLANLDLPRFMAVAVGVDTWPTYEYVIDWFRTTQVSVGNYDGVLRYVWVAQGHTLMMGLAETSRDGQILWDVRCTCNYESSQYYEIDDENSAITAVTSHWTNI